MIEFESEFAEDANGFGDIDFTKAKAFFSQVCRLFFKSKSKPSLIIVCHAVPDTLPFLAAISNEFIIHGIIIKPSSRHVDTHREINAKYPVLAFTKKDLLKTCTRSLELTTFEPKGDYIIIDIGGYFSDSYINKIISHDQSRLIGIVEDTENGVQKYEQLQPLSYPVVHVARSSLKEPEDYLVGQAIAFAIETVLRQIGVLTINKNVGILGYGKIGGSIAATWKPRSKSVSIYDTNAVRLIKAASHGYPAPSRHYVLSNSDILICATGQKSLTVDDIKHLKTGCYLASVTSADDEFDLDGISSKYSRTSVSEHITRLAEHDGQHFIHLINNGNPANFIYAANLGAYIHLVQAEMLAAACLLAGGAYHGQRGLFEINNNHRAEIAQLWLQTCYL
ncbi:adenosylhomocysteinase [Variovorax boronicumulans]|nr:NAD(P)-dependent oxidoreductase [Variovorax boronicumulans]MDP9991301.1 adenosylhomocysteinase [Variovorax boronicumulans]MDQ0003335.1 adenosylhomocysteinase [Variovorax boronicumulans]